MYSPCTGARAFPAVWSFTLTDELSSPLDCLVLRSSTLDSHLRDCLSFHNRQNQQSLSLDSHAGDLAWASHAPPGSVAVYLRPPIWCVRATFRSKIDGSALHVEDDHLRIVSQPHPTQAGKVKPPRGNHSGSTALERRGKNMNRLKDFHLKAKAKI